MSLFLVVYNQRTRAVRVTEFGEGDRALAVTRRVELVREHRDEPEVEVVLLGAKSIEALKETHGRYFRSLDELIHVS